MKIDVHVHTKKIKDGDSPKRNITPPEFCSKIITSNVKICAITNHNHFDLCQFEEIVNESDGIFQVWPGVELDVHDSNKRGHLLVIVNPLLVEEFNNAIIEMVGDISPNKYDVSISELVSNLDHLEPIYIPHFLNKTPSIGIEDIDHLTMEVSNPKLVIKEATNSISAGIFISHGHKTIYGSDIQNWNEYSSIAQNLPELRLPVESFEQFCLLLERDDSTIKTILNKKNHKPVTLNIFEGEPAISFEVYNDINVLFGSKGTGKTEILRALSKYYNDSGYRTQVFESNEISLEKEYDLKGRDYSISLGELDIESCASDFSFIRSSEDASVTSLKKYYEYYFEGETNKIAKSIKIRDYVKLDTSAPHKSFKEIRDLLDDLIAFIEKIKSIELYKDIIGKELFIQLTTLLTTVNSKLKSGLESKFVDYHTTVLFNHLVDIFTAEISRKTGKPEKPTTVGFQNYAKNRISIEKSAKKILDILHTEIPPKSDFVGHLGQKGKLFCKTEIKLQDGNIVDANYRHIGTTIKIPQRQIAKSFEHILKKVFTDSLFEEIENLNNIENADTIASIEDMLLFRRYFEAGHQEYQPSNGESAMILLMQELESDKEIYLIDEPEKSLGNDYINDFIVPLLKEHAYSGKRVIIATHDANIAVRTLPYNSIYREHDMHGYNTYVGNPFSNNLVCRENQKTLDWKETSMKTLEGGKTAFGERGKVYGEL